MTFFIAEISNHHLGSVYKAKELIKAAKNAGANAVKGQAFIAEDILQYGSMSKSFYEKCAFKYHEYKELIDYGKDIKIPVFFTILSKKLNLIASFQDYKKIHSGFTKDCDKRRFWFYDHKNYFISLSEPRLDVREIKNANILYTTPYLEDVDIEKYMEIEAFYQRKIGVSHHGKSASKLIDLASIRDLSVIEKHFFLGDEIVWDGKIYRDCLHSFDPFQFEALVKAVGNA